MRYSLPVDDLWYLLDSGAGAASWNMALDDALLSAVAELGRPILRFYSWIEPAATFGYFQRYAEVKALTALRPLIRRPTGGGLVPHSRDWTYSVVVPPDHSWYELSAVASYKRVHEWLRRSFSDCGIATELAPCCNPVGPGQCFVGAEKYDLLLGFEKIAGAAQRRNRLGLLIQGSIQPPPHGLQRKLWQDAMVTAGPDFASRRFERMEDPRSVIDQTAQIDANRYGTSAYNQRR